MEEPVGNVKEYSFQDFEMDLSKLRNDIKNSGRKYDFIVGLSRGGLIPAVVLSHSLNIPMFPVEFSTRDSKFVAVDVLTLTRTWGKNVLIVEDIIDSGETMERLIPWFRNTNKLDIATLIYNNEQSIVPTYYGQIISRSKDDKWYEFWWEKNDKV